MADDVAHGQAHAAVGEGEDVVPVAAHLRPVQRGDVGGGDVQPWHGRQVRQQAPLQRQRRLALALVEADVVERQARSVAHMRRGDHHVAVEASPVLVHQAQHAQHAVTGHEGHHERRSEPEAVEELQLARGGPCGQAGDVDVERLRDLTGVAGQHPPDSR